MYILLINIVPNHMCIFLPIIRIIVNYTLRITNRYCIQINEGAVTKQPLKFKKLLVDYMKSTNNFFVFLSKKGPEGPLSLV